MVGEQEVTHRRSLQHKKGVPEENGVQAGRPGQREIR